MANDVKIGVGLDLSKIQDQANEISRVLSKLNLSDSLIKQFNEAFKNLENDLTKYQSKFEQGFKTKSEVTAFDKLGKQINTDAILIDKLFKDLKEKISGMSGNELQKLFKLDAKTTQEVENLGNQIKDIQKQIEQVNATNLEKLVSLLDPSKFASKGAGKTFIDSLTETVKNGNLEEANHLVDEFIKKQTAVQKGYETQAKNKGGWDQVSDAIRNANKTVTENIQQAGILKNALEDAAHGADPLREIINSLNAEQLDKIATYAQQMGISFNEAVPKVIDLVDGVKDLTSAGSAAAHQSQEMSSEITRLGERVKYFFSLTNGVMLLRRALRSAVETVKDLDKVMTETAVVTNFSVGDMWSQLPEYTERANALGVSIHDAYEAATLYYQQGLKTNQVMAVSNSTLKMARIAGLDAADATDRMTNALRGFNMEINETNADRVADVYSKLAAITASNVDEISTAMTKVASLANNANMTFENTAAFLAQIVETTRESAETAGTALKTVVARFSEVKKLYSEGDLMGKDEEGNDIDVNKVSVALRSAGVDLNEYLTGMKGLDQIFIELASKWNSLDQVQQRYIATMAAGSRQQSRFIALMSDYQRTQELTTAATNASGASQAQFEKTLDSLESKLNQLKNAWDTFLMGLANNEVIKFVVDLLTGLVSILNKITDILPGVAGSFSKLIVTFLGIKFGKDLLAGLMAGFATFGKKSADSFGTAFKQEFTKQSASFRKIFTKAFWVGKKEIKQTVTIPKESIDSLNNYTQATQKYNQAKLLQNNRVKAGIVEGEFESKLQNILTTQDQTRVQAIRDYAIAQNINEVQAEKQLATATALTGVQSLQLTNQEALLLAESGLNVEAAENISNTLTKIGITGTENAEMTKSIMLKAAEINGEKLENVEQAKSIALHERGLLGKIAMIGVRIKHIFAIKGETLAQTELNTTMAQGLAIAGAALIAIGALIGLAIALYKTIKNNSYAEQLKAAEEATRKAQEAAEQAKTTYDDLLSKHEEYSSLQNELNELTKGTKEWSEKLYEANNQVLNLIQSFPKLAQYLTIGKSGQLSISAEGWDSLIKSQQQIVGYTNASVVATNQRTQQLIQQDKLYEYADKYFSKAKVLYTKDELQQIKSGNSSTTYNKTLLDQILKGSKNNLQFWAQDSIDNFTNKEAKELQKWLHLTNDEFRQLRDATIKYQQELDASTLEQKARGTAAVTNLVDTMHQDFKYLDSISTAFGTQYIDKQFTNELEGYITRLDKGSDFNDNDLIKELAQNWEIELVSGEGTDRQNLEKLYAYATNSTEEAVHELELEEKDMLREIATVAKTESFSKEMNNFIATLKSASKAVQKNTAVLMDQTTNKLTKADLDEFKNTTIKDLATQQGLTANQYAQKIGYKYTNFDDLTKEQKRYLDLTKYASGSVVSPEDMAEMMRKYMAALADTTIKQNTFTLRGYGVSNVDKLIENMSIEVQENLVKQFEKLNMYGADTESISKQFEAILNAVSPKDQEAVWNQLLSVNLRDASDLETTLDTIRKTFVGADSVINNEFITAMIKAADAVRTFTEEGLNEAITSRKSAETLVTEKNSSRIYTKDEYDLMLKNGFDSSEFQQMGEDYVYLGEQTDLLDRIRLNTERIISEMTKEREKSIKRYGDWTNLESTEFNGIDISYEVKKQSVLEDVLNTTANFSSKNNKTYAAALKLASTGEELTEEEKKKYQGTLDSDMAQILAGQLTDLINPSDIEGFWGKFKDNLTSGLTPYLKAYSVEDKTVTVTETIKSFDDLAKKIQNSKIALEGLDQETLTGWFKQVGINSNLYEKYLKGGTEESLKKLQDFFAEMYTSDKANWQSSATNEKSVVVQSITENRISPYGGGAIAAEALNKTIEEQEDYQAALRVTAAMAEMTDAEVETLTNSLQRQGVSENQAKIQALGLATTIGKQRLAYNNAKESISNYISELKEGNNNLQIQRSLVKSIGKSLENSLKGTFGDIQISDEFISKHLTQLTTWVEGGTGAENAFNQIMKDLNNTLLESIGLTNIQESELSELLQSWNNENIGLNMYLNDEQLKGELDELPGYTEDKVKEIEAYLLSQGWQVTFKEENGLFKFDKAQRVSAGGYFGNKTGSGSSSSNKYEPDYDILYNLIADLEAIQKAEERLVDELDELKEKPNTSQEQITEKLTQLIDLYRKNYELENQKLQARQAQGQKVMSDNAGLQQYATLDTTTGVVHIDYDKIYSVTNENEGKRIDDYIKQLEEIGDDIVDSQDTLEEIEDKVEDLRDYGREDFLELEQRVMDSITKLYEDQIQELEDINDSINDANQKLLDNLQDSISKMRQDRENDKTEQEINDTATKLAYLQMDTSGSNQVEILNLQKQLDDQRQSYTDSLIDQKINELEEQNKVAQEQREEQIRIAQSQLEYAKENGVYWEDVDGILNDTKGKISQNTINAMNDAGITDMATLLKNGEGWISKSEEQRRDWEKEYSKQFRNASVYIEGGVNEQVKSTAEYFQKLQAGEGMPNAYLAAIADKDWKVTVIVDGSSVNVQDPPESPETPNTTAIPPTSYSSMLKSINDWYTKAKQQLEIEEANALADAQFNPHTSLKEVTKDYQKKREELEKERQRRLTAAAEKGKASGMGIQLQGYKTGGLADYTGPAWLDGTKSRPELVLNQRDTENFLQLRAILEQVMKGQNTNIANADLEKTLNQLVNNGEVSDQLSRIYEMLRALKNSQTNFNFDIDIDRVDDEDDITSLIERIKSEIYDDAMYRNVNVLNLIR